MPIFQEIFKNDVIRAVALGVSAALVAVAAIPLIVTASRPLARSTPGPAALPMKKADRLLPNPKSI